MVVLVESVITMNHPQTEVANQLFAQAWQWSTSHYIPATQLPKLFMKCNKFNLQLMEITSDHLQGVYLLQMMQNKST